MLRQVFLLPNHLPGNATGVRVFFTASRTRIGDAGVLGLPRDTSFTREFSNFGVDVRWENALAPQREIEFWVEVEGEPLTIAQTVWRDEHDAFVPGAGLLGDHAAAVVAASSSIRDLEAFVHALFVARCVLARNHPVHRARKYAEFFCEMDLHTNIKLLGYSGLPPAAMKRRAFVVSQTEPVLFSRMRQRRFGQALDPPPARDYVEHISSVLLGIYRKHLSNRDGGIDLEEVWTAFEMFANGELRVPEADDFPWNSEPDSAALFCFAEFGFMAAELQVDVEEWLQILPSQVAMQQIYMAAYRPKGASTFGSYLRTNWAKEKMVGPKRKAELRAHFWDMPLPELLDAAAIHLKEALADE